MRQQKITRRFAWWASEWIAGLLESKGVDVTAEAENTVWSALESLASAPEDQRTLTGLSALIQDGDLRLALKPFTLEGAYGHILDGNKDTLRDNAVQAFEMEELMHSKALVAPVLTYLFHKLPLWPQQTPSPNHRLGHA